MAVLPGKTFPAYMEPKGSSTFNKTPPFDPILNWFIPAHIFTPYFSLIFFKLFSIYLYLYSRIVQSLNVFCVNLPRLYTRSFYIFCNIYILTMTFMAVAVAGC